MYFRDASVEVSREIMDIMADVLHMKGTICKSSGDDPTALCVTQDTYLDTRGMSPQ